MEHYETSSSPFLNTREAAAYLGVSMSLLEKMRVKGDGPHYIKLGARVIYTREDLDALMRRRRVRSTSESER